MTTEPKRPVRAFAAAPPSGHLGELPDLPAELTRLLGQIPRGRVTTYGDLARALGDVAASRWVGQYLKEHPHGPRCPCHRVVRANGELGLYITGDHKDKQRRLADEGLRTGQGKIDVTRYGFRDFSSTCPLVGLSQQQLALAQLINVQPEVSCPGRLAAVDVAYAAQSGATAAYAEVDAGTGELLWSLAVSQPVRFPYIPGYLAFRELPVLRHLLREVRRRHGLADAVLVDGSGTLHPRQTGIATMLGIAEDLVTVGVTKKLLCGTFDRRALDYDAPQVIYVDGEPRGVALLARPSSGKPLFVSPGHRIDWRSAGQIVAAQRRGCRLPGPIWWADRICGQQARQERSFP